MLPGEPDVNLAKVAAGHIFQLQLLRNCQQWAVYVALHLPGAVAPAARAVAVRELLNRSALDWADDAGVKRIFIDTLKIPPAWLEEAQVRSLVYLCVNVCRSFACIMTGVLLLYCWACDLIPAVAAAQIEYTLYCIVL